MKDILPILDSKVAAALSDYAGDEVDTYYKEPLPELFKKHGSFRELDDEEKRRFRLLVSVRTKTPKLRRLE